MGKEKPRRSSFLYQRPTYFHMTWLHGRILTANASFHLAALGKSYNIPEYDKMAPAGTDYASVHMPGYCTLYEYAFRIRYSLPLNPLAEELCHLYGACLAQLTPYALKVCRIHTTYVAKAGKEVSVHHLLQMFSVSFMRGTMLQLVLCGKKGFVVQVDDKANRKFWKKLFYIRTDHLVSNLEGFPEAWNTTCKHSCMLI